MQERQLSVTTCRTESDALRKRNTARATNAEAGSRRGWQPGAARRGWWVLKGTKPQERRLVGVHEHPGRAGGAKNRGPGTGLCRMFRHGARPRVNVEAHASHADAVYNAKRGGMRWRRQV